MTTKPIDNMSEREFEQFLRLSGATRKQARDITTAGFRAESSPNSDLDDLFDDDAVTTAIAKMQRALISKGAV